MTALQDAKLQPNQIDKVILVGGPTRMPIVRTFVEDIIGKPAERGVDPMECVAIGAAIQGGIMAGEIDEIVLLDVTPLSLGVETLGGVFTRVMDKNTTIPAERKQIFSTAADFQTSVTINVLQGERQMAADNVSLGMFNLVGIPPAPRNVPQIEVKFDIDENGILNVTAKDLGTGKEQSITITASTKLDQSEIESMVKEAEQFAEQDKQKKEEVEVRNNADSMIYTAEKTLADLEEKLAKEQKDRIRNTVNELNEALKGEDISQIKAKTEALAKILQEIGTAVYQQVAQEQAAQQPPPGSETETTGTSPPPPGEKVVDADYEVVDDE